MTKKELQQIFYLSREIKMWQDELEKVKSQSTYVLSNGIRGGGISDKTGEKAAKQADIELIIEGKLAEIQLQRDRIMYYIMTVEDSLTRQILMYRHVNLMSWDMVAKTIGGGNTVNGLKQRHSRFFQKI